MADSNLFDSFDPEAGASPAPVPAAIPAQSTETSAEDNTQTNIFDQFDPEQQANPVENSDIGAFGRSAERSIVPAAGGLVGAGAGAEAGAAVGGGIGAIFGGVGAVPGAVAGGIIGGIAGGFGGSFAAEKGQEFAAQALPDSWKDYLGGTQAQQEADIKYHPTESFLGGMVPYVMTMRPGGWTAAARALPENATALQRIASNPATAHIFGGALMGGMELGNEVASGQTPDWRNVAIATGVGVVFNRPNQIGETLEGLGRNPVAQFTARGAELADLTAANSNGEPVAPTQPSPTIAQAADAKVLGPGITEDVFMGSHQQAPDAAMSAQDNARTEASILNPPAQPDLHAVARSIEPDLFSQYDDLSAQRDAFRAQLARMGSPADEDIQAAEQARDQIQAQLDAHLAARGGYAGGAEARGMRAQLRDAQSQLDSTLARRDAFAAGEGEDTPEMSAIRQHLLTTDYAMRDLAPQVSAAYRRAADRIGSGVVEPEIATQEAPVAQEAPSVAPPPETNEETPGIVAPSSATAASIQEQAAAIAQEVTQQLIRADRPPDEAAASGQLIGQRYATRSARLGRTISPAELYRTEGATIRGVGTETAAPSPELHPAAAEQMTRQELAEFIKNGGTVSAAQNELFQPAYHGSPHIFDRFSNDKIGTGEGAQAYGHGLYFAGKKAVAEWYREGLSHPAIQVKDPSGEWHDPTDHPTAFVRDAAGYLSESGGDIDRAIADANKNAENFPSEREFKAAADTLRNWKRDGFKFERGGRLYHVDIPEDSELLDWDKPLSEQPQHVQDALAKIDLDLWGKEGSDYDPSELGQIAYTRLASMKGGAPQASEALREAGVPGHTYIGDESNARNYVIYDDSRVGISNYEQGKRGSITFNANRKPLIKLFADADASTFIHETGHQWLEELMRDAVHPAATDVLKDDAQTVRDWLGVEDIGSPLKTRQHEKFARGFEQYMREGVAPSAGLARVFAQFKGWLTQIYQTIKGLGAPINDDIRQVFDRMLVENPQRTVVAPEMERRPGIVDLHETEAATVEPHEAEPAADRIIAERDNYIAAQPPEIQNELATAVQEDQQRAADTAAAARGEVGTVGTAEPDVGAGGLQPEPEPEGGGGGLNGSAVNGGGGEAARESTGVAAGRGAAGAEPDAGLRTERPEPAGSARTQPLNPQPTDLFGPAESPFLDKAGNIRLDTLTSTEDVRQALRDAADRNNDFIGERGGPVTKGQIIDLAYAAGMEGAEKLVRDRVAGQAFNPVEVMTLRLAVVQSATDLRALALKAKADDFSDASVLAYAQAEARHDMLQGTLSQATAVWGRTGTAFKNIIDGQAQAKGVDEILRGATGRTLFQTKERMAMLAALDTPEKVNKFVKDADKRTFGRMLLEYWINGLISGPATHTTYMAGNLLLSLEKAGPETAAAALIGSLRRSLGREGETVRMGEVGAQLQGAVSSLPMATKAAIDSLRTGVTTLLPGETPRSLPFQPGAELGRGAMIDEAMNYSSIVPELYGGIRGIRDGLISTGALVKAGGVQGAPLIGLKYSPLGAIPDIALKGVPVLPVGTLARIPSRGVAAIHSFFRAANYSMAKNALAYRAAADAGLSGEALDAKIADLRQNPTPEMMEDARASATNLTLMGQGSEFVQALGKLTNAKVLGFPLLKFIDPFVHIAGNIIDQSLVQRTPLGLLAPEVRADLSGANGTVAQDTAMARMLVGTGIAIGFGSLAAQGLMSGSGPSNPNQAAMWRLAGNQAHSVRIGDVWYDVHRLGPLGMLASMSADMYDIAHAASKGDITEAGAGLLHAATQTLLDEGFMSGPSELIQALEDPGRYGASYVRNQLSSFVPYSVAMQQMDRATDPYSRRAKSLIDGIRNKVPGLSESLMPRRDIWGNPMPNLPAFGGRAFSAILAQQASNDPVNQAMLNLGIYPAPVEQKIRGVQLSDAQYDLYAQYAGRMAKTRLDTMVRSSAWRTWPPQVRHDIILETIRQSRETARGALMARFPTIAIQATQAKLAPFQGGME